jgi:fructose-1,6-bisphosphatase I
MDKLITIERHLIDRERELGASGTFSQIMYDVALCAKLIARETRRLGLTNMMGATSIINVQGELQQKLDVFANDIIIRMNSFTGRFCIMASEEEDDPIDIPQQYGFGKYVLVFDPLDGSSNIDTNVSVGTIFGVYRRKSSEGRGDLDDILQKGNELVAAGYVIYGPSTMMVYTTGREVSGFTLHPTLGEFILSHPNIKYPQPAKYYSVNQANQRSWHDTVQAYTRWMQGEGVNPPKKALSLRYVGSLVADFHRNLLEGGVYYYPSDKKNINGKLRLVYEANPLSFIAKAAGGYASNGAGPILDMQPEQLHQRVPLFIGDKTLVMKAEEFTRSA